MINTYYIKSKALDIFLDGLFIVIGFAIFFATFSIFSSCSNDSHISVEDVRDVNYVFQIEDTDVISNPPIIIKEIQIEQNFLNRINGSLQRCEKKQGYEVEIIRIPFNQEKFELTQSDIATIEEMATAFNSVEREKILILRNNIGSPNDSNLMLDKADEIQKILEDQGVNRTLIMKQEPGTFGISKDGESYIQINVSTNYNSENSLPLP